MFTKRYFDKTADGQSVFLFENSNSNGIKVQILSYGGTVVSLQVPDRQGKIRDVVLGYDTLKSYENQDKYLGALVGRCANRIGGSCFSISGKRYLLSSNENKNHLHGGMTGFDKKIWADQIEGENLILSYLSPHGEEGYPGTLTTKVTYSLSEQNELCITYEAVSDLDTVVSLTNHCYFNLNGHDSGKIEGHFLKINGDQITPVNREMISLGTSLPVADSPFDFREFHPIGERIHDTHEQLRIGGGYDHNYILNGQGMRLAAELMGDESKIKMLVYTDMDGMQLYTGNFLKGAPAGKNGAVYQNRDAVCLETQFLPNAVNCPDFPSPILRAGENYHRQTIYRFETIE